MDKSEMYGGLLRSAIYTLVRPFALNEQQVEAYFEEAEQNQRFELLFDAAYGNGYQPELVTSDFASFQWIMRHSPRRNPITLKIIA